jgi:cyclopropane fatty-acyl-phospholipid synthase-like methyltransferase
MNFRERLLGNTFVYKSFKNLVAPPSKVAASINDFMSLADGKSVLDLGCGYGDVAKFYANRCRYVGIDSNESYIETARRRNSNNDAEFLVGDISDPEILSRGPFDLVILTGVLHHLPNEHVAAIAGASKKLVSDDGRFVAIEPVFSPDQRLSARLLIASDRGRYVRDSDGYMNLLKAGFDNVSGDVVHGRLRIPYSHVILTCQHS